MLKALGYFVVIMLAGSMAGLAQLGPIFWIIAAAASLAIADE